MAFEIGGFLILMDEPFGPLDAITKMALQNLLLRLWQERQKTIIYVTHDIAEAITLGDRVVIMTKRPGTVKAVLPVSDGKAARRLQPQRNAGVCGDPSAVLGADAVRSHRGG